MIHSLSKESRNKLLYELLACAVGVAIAFIPAPEGLDKNAMYVIATLVWAIINWITRAIPDFAAVLLMSCAWVIQIGRAHV